MTCSSVTINVALGILLAFALVLLILAGLCLVVAGWLLLWQGIDDYGPLKHWWLEKKHSKSRRR